MPKKTLTVSIDMDGLTDYLNIHGQSTDTLSQEQQCIMYTRGLPRCYELMQALELPLTIFVIGRDIAHDPTRQAITHALVAGHEIGNHSHAHNYHLSRLSAADILSDLQKAHQALCDLGANPRGFRAPGYHLSPALLTALQEINYHYDSSRLPSPLYYAAKVGIMTLYMLARKPSKSLRGPVRDFLGPLEPHQLRPGLLEIPISALGPLGLPCTGTMLTMAPGFLRSHLQNAASKLSHVQLEFHGIDFLDTHDDALLQKLATTQADLQLPWKHKIDRYRRFLEELLQHGHQASTLNTLAQDVASIK